MEKILLIAGCSHTAGSEINGQEDSVYNRQQSFGAQLARMLGRTPVNIAINGATNGCIARTVLKWFEHNYDPTKYDVQVLVAWTESTRMEVPSEREFLYRQSSKCSDWYDTTMETYFRINMGWEGGDAEEKALFPRYQRFIAENEPMLELWTANYILQIQYFLKSMNIKYLMCNTMHMFTANSKHVKEMTRLVDETNYYMLHGTKDDSFFWKYRNLGFENPKAKYWHHDERPHQLYAEELYKFIEENKCLTG